MPDSLMDLLRRGIGNPEIKRQAIALAEQQQAEMERLKYGHAQYIASVQCERAQWEFERDAARAEAARLRKVRAMPDGNRTGDFRFERDAGRTTMHLRAGDSTLSLALPEQPKEEA